MEWIKKNWMFPVIILVAVLILAVVTVLVMPGMGNTEPTLGQLPDGPETGIYYYDTEDGEYLLMLNSGNKFTISGPELNKTGTYSVTEVGIELDFVKDSDGTGTIVKDGEVLNLQYKEITMRFIKKVTYTVNFNTNGGSVMDSVEVVNGKCVSEPAEPTKKDSVFLGWFADEACTLRYNFGVEPIAADTTIYAKWAETVVGQNEYIVDFDLGYEAEGFAAMTTIGGKLFNVPTPEREGYTFGGWWISMTEKADELTAPYTSETVFQANTTLFAVWQETTTGPKLPAPMVEVYDTYIAWNAIKGVTTYQLKITDAKGNVIVDKKVGATTETFEFAKQAAGAYTVEVMALSTVEANNSDTTVRTYINKALERVSLFTVIDGGILLWNTVDGAEKYRVTVECGNKDHNHTNFDNGESTTFVFANCAMQEGGIRFVITAVAEGRADSVSEVFVYDRKLDAVGQILYNEETQTFYWDAVANATNYYVTLVMGEERIVIDNGSATTFSVKHLSGEIKLEVVPVTQGYNSPEAATTTYNKTSLAAPTGLAVKGNVLSWNAVDGATGYKLKINNQTFQCTTNSVDVTSLSMTLDSSTVYEISVMAVGAKDSLYSDTVTMKYLAQIESVTYKNNTVTWAPVIGVEKYEIRVNGEVVLQGVEGNSAMIKLTKAGVNLVEVRYTDKGGSDWTGTEVFAYTVIYDSRSLSGIREEYLAMGDTMSMPTDFTNDGYDFAGWYNAPGGASGNGAEITDPHFNGNGSIVLYANWTPKTYQITFAGLDGVTNMTEGQSAPVVYKSYFQLPVPEADKARGYFDGWYTEPDGCGEAITDSEGKSLANYAYTRDLEVYPFFDNGVLTYLLQADGTYGVTRGKRSANVTSIYIPEFYRDIPVTAILDNAFYELFKVESIYIPATIRSIGVGAIPNYEALKHIEVYTDTVQQNYEPIYASSEGALIRYDMGEVYLELFPRGKTGEYVIPDDVTVLRDNVFRYAQITKLTIGIGVHTISRRAFYSCQKLKTVEFVGKGTNDLKIDAEAFYRTSNVTTLRLPARLTEMDFQMINQFTKLTTLEVEEGGAYFSSKDNYIFNAAGTVILFAAMDISGEYEIPKGIREIGPMAYNGRTALTKITIPSYVINIGDNAFQNCSNVAEIVVTGGRNFDLNIGNSAFIGCERITKVTFQGNKNNKLDPGLITIGNSAFENDDLLGTVVFEAGVNVALIGDRAFANSKSLHTVIYSDGAVISTIGNEVFSGCTQLKEAVIPATTTTLGNGVFSGCERIQSVVFQSRQEEITFGTDVFAGCTRLTVVNLPAMLNYFDATVFAGCDSITKIVVDPANAHFVDFGGALYTKDYTELLFYPRNLDGNMRELHPDLQKIGPKIFQNNPKITQVYISKNITHISEYAFEGCQQLNEVVFEEGVGALTIGEAAFANCINLTAIALPEGITTLSDNLFYNTGLTSFVIPESVTRVEFAALASTKITTIHIPANVEFIGDAAFYGCTNMTGITFADGDKPLELGTLENTNKNYGVFNGTTILEFVACDRITLIGNYAFQNQVNLTSVIMGENSQIAYIGQYAFSNTKKLETVILSPKLKGIGASAFYYNEKMQNIFIPKSVELIEDGAFRFCTGLTEITFEPGGENPLNFKGTLIFNNCSKLEKITLPARLNIIYSTKRWNGTSVKTLVNHFTGSYALKTIEMEEGSARYLVDNDVIYEYDENGKPTILLFCAPGKTGDLVVPKEVRKVEHGAFYSTKLTSISFEEYTKGVDEEYGQQLLVIGDAHIEAETHLTDNSYKVISLEGGDNLLGGSSYVGNLVSIHLPSHLAKLGAFAFGGLKGENLTINFNMDAKLQAIEGGALSNTTVKKLELPAVAYLGIQAFMGSAAQTVTFHPDSTFNALPDYVFSGCGSLTSVSVPAMVVTIGKEAFSNCKALSDIQFAENGKLQQIDGYAFKNTAFTEFVFPNTVINVGEKVFSGCKQLRSVTLSLKMTSVTYNTFDCGTLEAIHVPEGHSSLMDEDGVLYNKSKTTLYLFPQQKDPTGFALPDTLVIIRSYAMKGFQGTHLILPETLETIEGYAFQYSALTSIHIPAKVKTIGAYAFQANSSGKLQSVTFEENGALKTISNYAFAGNTWLTRIDLPDNITSLGTYAFEGCYRLEEVILPAALKQIQNNTFSKCRNLRTVVLQEGIEKIANYAFSESGVTEMTIPSTVKEIGNYGFSNAKMLRKFTFADGSKLTTLGTYVFQNCVSLESLKLPASLKDIKTVVFSYKYNGTTIRYDGSCLLLNCAGLKTLDMSACEEILTLPGRFMTDAVSLETLLLPPALESIQDFAFGDPLGKLVQYSYDVINRPMRSLKQIEFPGTLLDIGAYAFYGCESLESIVFHEECAISQLGNDEQVANRPYWGTHMFAGSTSLKTVVWPTELSTIGPNCFENSGLAEIVIPEGVDKICDSAFKNCDNLVNMPLPQSLVYLGDEAFFDCDNLTSASMSFGLETMGALAFGFCEKLTEGYIPASVTSLRGNPYAGCTGITNFSVDRDNADYIMENGVVYDKTMYTLVYYPASSTAETFRFPESVQEIAVGAFASAQLKELEIPTMVTKISDYAFFGAELERVTFHRGVTIIGNHAFDNCKNLNNVTVLNNIKYLGNYAFANCTSLSNFVFEDIIGAYTIGQHFFDGCTSMTQLILPNLMTITEEEAAIYLTGTIIESQSPTNITNMYGIIPAYMFANTGIVHAVIPERINDIHTIGVFYGCKDLQTVTFEAEILNTKSVGNYYFAGCTSLREIQLSMKTTTPFWSSIKNGRSGAFMDCTALENVVIQLTTSEISGISSDYDVFKNCSSLKSVQILNAKGQDISFSYLRDGTFVGCAGLEKLPDRNPMHIEGAPFVGSGLKVLHFTRVSDFAKGATFAGMPELEAIFIKSGKVNAETFTNLETEVKIYFYNLTYDEVVKASGNEDWFTNADPKAQFFFKDTMPEDVQIPEDTDPYYKSEGGLVVV